MAGLAGQGELNVDVMDRDACEKLSTRFAARWEDRFCIDISSDLAEVIEQSWAREALVAPYHIYVKMAYHLSQEARFGLATFEIPRDFTDTLLEFQKAAVKIAAHRTNIHWRSDSDMTPRLRTQRNWQQQRCRGLPQRLVYGPEGWGVNREFTQCGHGCRLCGRNKGVYSRKNPSPEGGILVVISRWLLWLSLQ